MCADYHYIRNYLYVQRHMGARRADQHMPEFAKRLVAMYDKDGAVSKRCTFLWASYSGFSRWPLLLAAVGAVLQLGSHIAFWLSVPGLHTGLCIKRCRPSSIEHANFKVQLPREGECNSPASHHW